MKIAVQLAFAVFAGVVIGAFGVEATRAQSRPSAFVVAEFEVTDPAGWKTCTDGVRASPGGGTFLVRAAKGTPLAGAPRTITLVQFAGVEEAIAFDASPWHAAVKPTRDGSSNRRPYVVEGARR